MKNRSFIQIFSVFVRMESATGYLRIYCGILVLQKYWDARKRLVGGERGIVLVAFPASPRLSGRIRCYILVWSGGYSKKRAGISPFTPGPVR